MSDLALGATVITDVAPQGTTNGWVRDGDTWHADPCPIHPGPNHPPTGCWVHEAYDLDDSSKHYINKDAAMRSRPDDYPGRTTYVGSEAEWVCRACGDAYTTENRALNCCGALLRCAYCGGSWNDQNEAEACCSWQCDNCEERYTDEESASGCCA